MIARSTGYTSTTQVPLYWGSYGPPGAPRLLVLHGGPGAHHDYLLPQMLDLADEHELVFYDQRGGGRSKTDQQDPITWRTHVEDLARVVAELELDPLSLVGYSWGGLLALLYAIESFAGEEPSGHVLPPQRMVLIDPASVSADYRHQFEQEFARRQSSPGIERLRRELAESGLRERDQDAYRHRLFELGVAGYFADPGRARDLTPFRVMGRVQQSVWESLGDFDFTDRLPSVRCPVLVVHGTEDPIPVASSRSIVEALPDAELVVLDGSGHVPYVEAPDALFAAIRRFLQTTGGAIRA